MFRLRRLFQFAIGMIAIVCACGFVVTGAAHAAQDITPPKLVDVSFEPATIDTSNGPQTITVTVHVTDDLSGMWGVALYFRRAGTTQERLVEFRTDGSYGTLIEGDVRDGIFLNTITLPQYSAFGRWELHAVYTQDMVGNRLDGFKPELGPEDYERAGWSPLYDSFVFWNGPQETEPAQPETFALFLPAIAP